jgi:hypothetical protein
MATNAHDAHAPLGNESTRKESKLRLISTPVSNSFPKSVKVASMGLDARGEPDIEDLGFRYTDEHDCPEFIKVSLLRTP